MQSDTERRASAANALRARWARPDSRTRARARILARYEAIADPECALDPETRRRLAARLLREDMTQLSRLGVQARARRRAEGATR